MKRGSKEACVACPLARCGDVLCLAARARDVINDNICAETGNRVVPRHTTAPRIVHCEVRLSTARQCGGPYCCAWSYKGNTRMFQLPLNLFTASIIQRPRFY